MAVGVFDLSGRSAIVTGAASGIGRATSVVLARAGASVVCADIDEDGAYATSREISASGGAARPARVDVSKAGQLEMLVDSVVSAVGTLDIMCNVAGIMHNGSVTETSEDDLDRVLAVNFKGVLFGCQAAVRVMTKQRSGSIVNMSSAIVDIPAPNTLCYAVSKAAIVTLTTTLAMEVGDCGVRVNAVAPGFISTAITERHFLRPDGSVDEAARDATFARMAAQAPLGRIGEPADVAYTVLYLASDAASFMTGQILRPNGGFAMR
jgi:3-oxoacyl-[acyl-carrier protein] reductase